MFDHCIHATSARPFGQRQLQVLQLIGLARSQHLDVPVRSVAHPAAQSKLRRLALHEPAKTNALHTALDQKMLHHNGGLLDPVDEAVFEKPRSKRTGRDPYSSRIPELAEGFAQILDPLILHG